MFTLSRAFCLSAALALLLLVVLAFAACASPRAHRGGSSATVFSGHGRSNSTSLVQSENPKEPSRQTVQSEQTIDCVLPVGSALQFAAPGVAGVSTNRDSNGACLAVLAQPVPMRVVSKDRVETSIGGAQKDTMREWAGKAANLRPVMWAGIVMMTAVAGVLLYFGWWTKAAVAAAVGLGMIVAAQTVPGHGAAIVLSGLAVFGLAALLILYAYYKGQLDRDRNGIPDFLERSRDVPF